MGQFIIEHLSFEGEEVALARVVGVVGVVGVLAAKKTLTQSRVEMVLYETHTILELPASHQLFYG